MQVWIGTGHEVLAHEHDFADSACVALGRMAIDAAFVGAPTRAYSATRLRNW